MLALHAGGDLGIWTGWLVARHVARCRQCRSQVAVFHEAIGLLRSEADELPPGLNWRNLASEMTANIHVGLAAGECIGVDEPEPKPLWFRTAAVAPALALVLFGFLLQRPQPRVWQPQWVEGTVIGAVDGAIELRHGNRMLSLRGPEEGKATYLVKVADAQGGLQSGYVDPDTGQVTIQNVYAQ
jgi:hypothetical protein